MDNFRRRVEGKPITLVGEVWSPVNVTINSFTPRADIEIGFSTRIYRIDDVLSITVDYDIYEKYSDGSKVYKSSSSITKDVHGNTAISATKSSVRFDSDIITLPSSSNAKLRITYDFNSGQILKTDNDGTSISSYYDLKISSENNISDYIRINNYAKVTLTKQGDSGSGNVLLHVESV